MVDAIKLNNVEETDLIFRAKQLRDLCDDFIKSQSDEFYSEEEKAFFICQVSRHFLEEALKKFDGK